jgi:NAD(P)-dependent dehydrogenase (short-subunit alcohol dehydrogenase family)
MRLEGKIAVITGAGSGMGRAMANLFAAEGAKVVAADWHQETLDEVVEEVRAAGGDITGVQGNVAVREDCERLIDTAVSTYGGLDVLCNNAGVMDLFQGVAHVEDDLWRRVMGINVDGPMFLSRKAVPIMIARGGGSIVNTASAAGAGGGAAGCAYTASKHALVGLTRSTAYTYALQGIRCNAMACGAVETNIMQSVDPTKLDMEGAARYQGYQALAPAYLKPVEVANLALFLASDESKHVNGAIIPIDAGWTAA